MSIYFGWVLLAAALAGTACTATGALLTLFWFSREPGRLFGKDPVTVLRPLHGASAGLESALLSTLEQSYDGPIQLVCGVHSSSDPARLVVEDLQRKHPERDITLVVDSRVNGANHKVSNLMNMMSAAKHDIIFVVDADIVAPPQWLSSVVALLDKNEIGAVTCFYSGRGADVWSRLGAMSITYQFMPNALFGMTMRLAYPFLGATMALRRQMLEEIGGFGAIRNSLADDYEIGRAVRAEGYRLGYATSLVTHLSVEANSSELWNQEVRWARTIRTINPWGHLASLVTHGIPLALVGAVMLAFSPAALAALGLVFAMRLLAKLCIDHAQHASSGPLWMLPLRDLLSLAVFVASVLGLDVNWRGERLRIGKGRVVTQVSG